MKKFALSVAVLLGLAAVALPAVRTPRVKIPPPDVIIAEENATLAARTLFTMDYASTSNLYKAALPRLPENMFHKRLYARALAHMGLWKDAAVNLAQAATDTAVRSAAEADMERVRALDAGRVEAAPASGQWEPMKVEFAQNAGVGAVAVLADGTIATALPAKGSVAFWSPSGRNKRVITGLGTPTVLVADGNGVRVADMGGNRIFHVTPEGISSVIDLEPLGVRGTRSVDIAANGDLWVADYGNGRAVKISRQGRLITQAGAAPINGPVSVLSVGSDLLVAESEKDRVLRFDRNGRLLRCYVHRLLKSPAALARIPGGFLVQGKNGFVFWGREGREDLAGPLPELSGVLITSGNGIAGDAAGNFWWGDGNSLQMARRIPADQPAYLVEIVRVEAGPSEVGGNLLLTASVMSKSGSPIQGLDAGNFRVLKGDTQLFPLSVEDLSTTMRGRRLTIVMESSDALLAHKESLEGALAPFFRTLTLQDKVSLIDVTDTFKTVRNFTVSPELLRRAVFEERRRVATLDLRSFNALENSMRMLAPSDYARGIIWITSGEDLSERDAGTLKRMGIINQIPIFIVHIGDMNRSLLEGLASGTNGQYFKLYASPSPTELGAAAEKIRSGRYRISAFILPPSPDFRGHWVNVTLEAYYLTEAVFDKAGYYSF